MTVIIQKSICHDCIWKDSCGSLKKIDEMRDRRNNPGHINSLFEAIIVQCSMKDYDRSYNGEKDSSLFYCLECGTMHRNDSRIGMMHKKKMEEQRIKIKKGADKEEGYVNN